MIEKKTASEKQLKGFLKHKKEEKSILLSLTGQGGVTTVLKEPLNICRVEIGEVTYLFGGISEDFYDKMVKKYHHEAYLEEPLLESVLQQIKADINRGDYGVLRDLLRNVIVEENEAVFIEYLP